MFCCSNFLSIHPGRCFHTSTIKRNKQTATTTFILYFLAYVYTLFFSFFLSRVIYLVFLVTRKHTITSNNNNIYKKKSTNGNNTKNDIDTFSHILILTFVLVIFICIDCFEYFDFSFQIRPINPISQKMKNEQFFLVLKVGLLFNHIDIYGGPILSVIYRCLTIYFHSDPSTFF